MVILYNPPSSARPKPILPLSLLALGAVLEGEYDYRILDGNLNKDPVSTLDRTIRETATDVLAVTVMPGPQLGHAVPHCRELKRRFPHLTIVWGGYFPSQHFDACLRSSYVDYVIRGHGELAFNTLLDRLMKGANTSDVIGLVGPSGGEGSNGLPPVPDPDALPDFPYHRLDMNLYVRNTFMGRTLSHHSSYGCPFLCNFCAVVNLVNGRWKAQSAGRTARVVRSLVENWRAEAIEFLDSNFFVKESRVREFSQKIMDLRIRWWGEARVDTLLGFSDRTWELMARSGLKMVFMGAESGSDETLRRMKKGGRADVNKTLVIAEKMRKYDIVPEFSFLLGNPPDPESDIDQTLSFIREVKSVNPDSEIIMYLYTPVPLEGDLYQHAQARGFTFPATLDEWVSPEWQDFSMRRSERLPWIGKRQRRKLSNFERVLNAYYPTSTDPSLSGLRRHILRATSSWRYHFRLYCYPLELRILHRLFHYQRPETSGF